MTRSLLWEEYRAEYPDGFGYAWFCEHYEIWKGRLSPTMRQSHAAREKVFVNYAGDTIDLIDPATGAVRAMKLFVAAMGASSYVYAEARPREGLADWIGCHVGLFGFLGGVWLRGVRSVRPKGVRIGRDGLVITMPVGSKAFPFSQLRS